MENVSIGLAFLAGLASFLAPCMLPLVPAYLGYLSGYAVVKPEGRTWQERFFIVLHAVTFVVGFSTVFIVLGVTAGAIGRWLRGDWFRYAGGLVAIFFGLALMGLLHLPILDHEAGLTWRGKPEWGFLSSFLMGMVFAAGWTPCVGPALSTILILSAEQNTVGRGALLLTAYSMGIGLPFIVAGFLVDQAGALLRKTGPYLNIIQKVAGGLLLIVGVLLISDNFHAIELWLEERRIGWNLGL